MTVRLRMLRAGTKKKPFYRIVAMDQRSPRNSRYIEKLGHYDPTRTPVDYKIDEEMAIKHLNLGAQPSAKVKNLLSKAGILKKIHEQKYAKKDA